MKYNRIKLQHMESQSWQYLRDRETDIERIYNDGPQQPNDIGIIRSVLGFTLARMRLIDRDLKEA